MGILDFISKKENKVGSSEPGYNPQSTTTGPPPKTNFASFPFRLFFEGFEIGTPIYYSSDKAMVSKYQTLCMAFVVEDYIIDIKKNLVHDEEGNFSIRVKEKLVRVPPQKLKRFSVLIPDTSKDADAGKFMQFQKGKRIYLRDGSKPNVPILHTVIEKTFAIDEGNFANVDAVELRVLGFDAVEENPRRAKRVDARIPVKIQLPGATDKALASAIISNFNESGLKINYSPTATGLAALCKNAVVGVYITRPAGAHSAHPEVLRFKGSVIWNKKNETFGIRLTHVYKDKVFQPISHIDGIMLKGFLVNHPLCQG
ncbi:MAG: hypothetical protein HQK84_10850 [Nitrospinae bacterium]|nr:hypothetical protein [Nitrospinota bacterium]